MLRAGTAKPILGMVGKETAEMKLRRGQQVIAKTIIPNQIPWWPNSTVALAHLHGPKNGTPNLAGRLRKKGWPRFGAR